MEELIEHIIVIQENSKCRIVPYVKGTVSEQLHQLQAIVGGNIERAAEDDSGHTLFVNEEGPFRKAKINWLATKIMGWAQIYGTAVIARTVIDGDGEVIICGMDINEAVTYLRELAQKLNHTILIEVGGDTEC